MKKIISFRFYYQIIIFLQNMTKTPLIGLTINELKEVSRHIPVICYGLLTNFKTELFDGSKRLVEIADSLMEIKTVCSCGRKATVNARFIDNSLCTDGEEIVIGGDETYKAMCYNCYTNLKKEKYEKENATT